MSQEVFSFFESIGNSDFLEKMVKLWHISSHPESRRINEQYESYDPGNLHLQFADDIFDEQDYSWRILYHDYEKGTIQTSNPYHLNTFLENYCNEKLSLLKAQLTELVINISSIEALNKYLKDHEKRITGIIEKSSNNTEYSKFPILLSSLTVLQGIIKEYRILGNNGDKRNKKIVLNIPKIDVEDAIPNMVDKLKSEGFVSNKGVIVPSVKRFLYGENIGTKKKIPWEGTLQELHYFLKELQRSKYVKFSSIWKQSLPYFEIQGQPILIKQLHHTKDSFDRTRKGLIDDAIGFLKGNSTKLS